MKNQADDGLLCFINWALIGHYGWALIGPSLGPTLAQGSGKGDFRSTSATASKATALAARKLPGAEDTAEVVAKATKATAPAKATDRLVAVATSKAAAKAAVSIEAAERLGC